MPTFRKKMANLLRQLSNSDDKGTHSSAVASSESNKPPPEKPAPLTLVERYLSGERPYKKQPSVVWAKSCHELPIRPVTRLSRRPVLASYSGPHGGLACIHRPLKPFDLSDVTVDFIDEDLVDSGKALESKNNCDNQSEAKEETTSLDRKDSGFSEADMLSGVTTWDNPTDYAYGIATSLYERHPENGDYAGDPIADTFGICVRENSAVLVLADGVNWGAKSRLASQCAVRGCMDYLNRSLYQEGSRHVQNSMDILVCLLRSFYAAHTLILQEDGELTTLCAAVVCPIRHSSKYLVCTCNVGDSLAYVYSPTHGVREITLGSHDVTSSRDMRDALGALGPVDGQNPELNNLTISMTMVEAGDIVFLCSDGISDNFDPVVGKFALPRQPNDSRPKRLPVVTPLQRHHISLLKMEELLSEGVPSAQQLCEKLINYASKLTTKKRQLLEDPELYKDVSLTFAPEDQKLRRRKVGDKLAALPGKLDHASVVAYKVSSSVQQKSASPRHTRRRPVVRSSPARARTPVRTFRHSKVSHPIHQIESSL